AYCAERRLLRAYQSIDEGMAGYASGYTRLCRRLLATHHLGNPDGCVRRRTSGRRRIVDENAELFTNADGASAVRRVMDADFGEAVVHRPLLGRRSILHLDLDLVQQPVQVQPGRAFYHPIGRQAPTSPSDQIRVVLPAQTHHLRVLPRLDDVG